MDAFLGGDRGTVRLVPVRLLTGGAPPSQLPIPAQRPDGKTTSSLGGGHVVGTGIEVVFPFCGKFGSVFTVHPRQELRCSVVMPSDGFVTL